MSAGPTERRTRAAALALAALLLAGPAAADCAARVNGTDVVISDEAWTDLPDATLRERLLSLPRRGWDTALGRPPACDSAVVLTFLWQIEAMPPKDAELYCLAGDGTGGWLLIPGDRDWRGRCDRALCERVNVAADSVAGTVATVMALRSGEVPGLSTGALADGAIWAYGTETVVRELFEMAADAALSTLLDSPLAQGAAAVTVLAAGGALYLCT